MSSSARAAITLQLCVLTLLSAFLLFQVQPVISKFILPWFGGSPGVWTTCVLFFQIVLFAGYAYAHFLTWLPRRWQLLVHGVLVLAAAVSLPIAPGDQWKPTGAEEPTGRILMLLLANVALPYFVLSSTSPLVQVWFTRAAAGRAPWRLYALSNLGSLAALLTYPFVFEPRWDVVEQTRMWSAGFVAFALLSLIGAYFDWKSHRVTSADATGTSTVPVIVKTPRWWQRVAWLCLPALASVLLLAATNHLCQDVAVIPFLWVVPLSLYLVTFIICFEHERWYVRWLWAPLAMLFLFATAVPEDFSSVVSSVATQWMKISHLIAGSAPYTKNVVWDVTPDFRWEIGLVCMATFLGCMVCHGELARLKPDPSRLTEFYLMMSAGGALGGLFVSQAAPRLFNTYLEWPGVLLACMGLGFVVAVFAAWRTPRRSMRTLWVTAAAVLASIGAWQVWSGGSEAWNHIKSVFPVLDSSLWRGGLAAALILASAGALLMVALGADRWSRLISASAAAAFTGSALWWGALHAFKPEPRIDIVRNFYGVISVEDEFNDEGEGWRTLYHGRILHGRQYLSETWRNEPLSYYSHESGIGITLETLKDKPDARVGVVGMGTGTVAAYGRKGHVFRFYDINPAIVRFAREHFHFLEDMERRGGTVEVALGDARLSLEHEPPQKFDALLLDAFSGDSVPVHLLTREAFEIYQRHMKPDGIIAVHVSNRYLALAPVIEKVAASIGMKTTRIFTDLEGFLEATDYVLVSNNEAFINAHGPAEPPGEEPEAKTLWTDKKSNLFECLITN
jgi:SAM-dependent methyltransferase